MYEKILAANLILSDWRIGWATSTPVSILYVATKIAQSDECPLSFINEHDMASATELA